MVVGTCRSVPILSLFGEWKIVKTRGLVPSPVATWRWLSLPERLKLRYISLSRAISFVLPWVSNSLSYAGVRSIFPVV